MLETYTPSRRPIFFARAIDFKILFMEAEYQYLRMIGGDAVGMSTVPEVLMANYLGMKCAAISVLTNDASEAGTKPVSLTDVIDVASKSAKKLTELFIGLIKEL